MASLADRITAKSIPHSVTLETTWRCNLACAHCYLAGRRHAEMSAASWIGVLDDLRGAGVLQLPRCGRIPGHR